MDRSEESLANETTYTQILRSTAIIGGSSAINIIFRIIQAKAAAVLLGPAGVGLMGIFNATLGLAGNLAGMGLSTSGVRQIAEAAAGDDEVRIARSVTTFRRLTLFFGLLGALIFFVLRQPIARITFGNEQHAPELGWLAIALLLMTVSSAQSAFIRGMRRIGDLARVSILGIAIGTLLGIPLLYFFREQGVAIYLIFSALTTIIVSWWYSYKIPVAKVSLTWRELSGEGRVMLSLGIVFMATGMTSLATTYLVKVILVRQMGLDAAGLYEAANTLSNTYVGFVLTAMAADFFPHLASISQDRVRSIKLINAQVEIGLLIAAPGILALLALGPFLLQLLYSPPFAAAFEILRWQALGMFLRVISWPVAFLTIARGKGNWAFWSEVATNLFYLCCAWLCISWLGLAGIGVAFMLMYIFHIGLMTFIAHRLIGFQWALRNLYLTALILPVILAALLVSYFLPSGFSVIIGLALAVGAGIYSLQVLYKLLGADVVKAYWLQLKTRVGWKRG